MSKWEFYSYWLKFIQFLLLRWDRIYYYLWKKKKFSLSISQCISDTILTSLNISVYFSELTSHAILIWKLYFRVLRESSPIKHRGYWNKIKGVIWNLSFDFGGGCSEIKMAKIQKYELMAKKLLNPFFIYVSKGML